MFSSSKLTWYGSLSLAGIFLVLGMMGGKWGTSYVASASVNAVPVIDYIVPPSVPAGSSNIIMIIGGSGFGDIFNTAVYLTAIGYEDVLTPYQVLTDGISVSIPADLLDVPKLYTVYVVWSNADTIPTIPLVPPWDEVSNPVPFTVYNPIYQYLPIITKMPLFP
jgi:hypothetical protein